MYSAVLRPGRTPAMDAPCGVSCQVKHHIPFPIAMMLDSPDRQPVVHCHAELLAGTSEGVDVRPLAMQLMP